MFRLALGLDMCAFACQWNDTPRLLAFQSTKLEKYSRWFRRREKKWVKIGKTETVSERKRETNGTNQRENAAHHFFPNRNRPMWKLYRILSMNEVNIEYLLWFLFCMRKFMASCATSRVRCFDIAFWYISLLKWAEKEKWMKWIGSLDSE